MTALNPYSQTWRWDVVQAVVQKTGDTMTGVLATPGIAFPATQVVSADPNTLDDYEEGTWTPVLTSGGGTITSYTATGEYTKIGRLVFLQMSATITNAGTGTGVLNVAGLPFTPGANSSGGGREVAIAGFWISASISSGSTTMNLFKYDNTTPIVTNWQLRIAASYRV